jgi:20S proteasome alpha/beta subunit
MTSEIALPDFSVISERRKPAKRAMTYQVILCGKDGVVIASDKCEVSYKDGTPVKGNPVNKIKTLGRFAWAAYGGDWAQEFSLTLKTLIEVNPEISDKELPDVFAKCRHHTRENYKPDGPRIDGRVIFVSGPTRKIFCIHPLLHGNTDDSCTEDGRCIGGQISNTASFLYHRLHSTQMSVDALVRLAAYSVRAAHEFDSLMIDRLDVAVYRDNAKPAKFQFIETDAHWNYVCDIENSIREKLLTSGPEIKYKTVSE